ncbi:MAG: hypothetical protein K6U80_09760 [Firmicutes bacterium]|nr:hypothetical protein [Bacillota bacterium]
MDKAKRLSLALLLILVFSIQVSGNEYYLYDLEKNKILVMGANESQFVEKMDLEKNPDMLAPGLTSDQYLALFGAAVKRDSKGKIIATGQGGRLIIISLATGRTQDMIELGYPPYCWTLSENHRHFFITYRPTPTEPLELLYYDLKEAKPIRLAGFASEITTLEVSRDGERLLAVIRKPGEKIFQMLSLKISEIKAGMSLSAVKSLTVGSGPENLYLLGGGRLAVVDCAQAQGVNRDSAGSIKLIDENDLTVVEERKFKPGKSFLQWFEDKKTLIAGIDESDKCRLYKVDQNGFRYYEIPTDRIDLKYLPDQDCLYILTEKNLRVIDYANSAIKTFSTDGDNTSPANYSFWRAPNSELAVIYCSKNGRAKFLDLKNNKIIGAVTCGRIGAKILNTILLNFKKAKTVVATNPSASRFYLLNCNTNDITVFNQKLERVAYLVPEERLMAMYQVENPSLQALVVTETRLYTIDHDKPALKPLYEFKTKTVPLLFLEEKDRIIFMTNQVLLVLDPATLEVRNCFYLFGDPGQKFSRLKPGEQRYFFIPTLEKIKGKN